MSVFDDELGRKDRRRARNPDYVAQVSDDDPSGIIHDMEDDVEDDNDNDNDDDDDDDTPATMGDGWRMVVDWKADERLTREKSLARGLCHQLRLVDRGIELMNRIGEGVHVNTCWGVSLTFGLSSRQLERLKQTDAVTRLLTLELGGDGSCLVNVSRRGCELVWVGGRSHHDHNDDDDDDDDGFGSSGVDRRVSCCVTSDAAEFGKELNAVGTICMHVSVVVGTTMLELGWSGTKVTVRRNTTECYQSRKWRVEVGSAHHIAFYVGTVKVGWWAKDVPDAYRMQSWAEEVTIPDMRLCCAWPGDQIRKFCEVMQRNTLEDCADEHEREDTAIRESDRRERQRESRTPSWYCPFDLNHTRGAQLVDLSKGFKFCSKECATRAIKNCIVCRCSKKEVNRLCCEDCVCDFKILCKFCFKENHRREFGGQYCSKVCERRARPFCKRCHDHVRNPHPKTGKVSWYCSKRCGTLSV